MSAVRFTVKRIAWELIYAGQVLIRTAYGWVRWSEQKDQP